MQWLEIQIPGKKALSSPHLVRGKVGTESMGYLVDLLVEYGTKGVWAA